MIVYDPMRRPLEVGTPIHEGGEGWICPVSSQPAKLAKIYKPQNKTGRETKLRWMVANAPNDPGGSIGHASIAWPETLLFDEYSAFIGYMMPRIVNTRTLLQVFNPHLRAQSLTGCDGIFLHRVARNMAAAIGALHGHNYIIGDLNESNVLVTNQALVTVIDTDSFQAKEEHDGQIIFYPCPVGRPEYTPPELQGKRFKGEVRQPEQDAFALAVLIFQLLLGGNHPFRAIWLGKDAPPLIEERILLGLFPYAKISAQGFVAPPPNLMLDVLHPPLADLMLRCFVDGHNNPKKRPLPAEWENAVTEAEKFLCTCPNHHVYAAHLKQCPQCGTKPLQISPPIPTMAGGPVIPVIMPRLNPRPSLRFVTVLSSGTRTCRNCKTTIPASALFCPTCASAIAPKACTHCGFSQVPQGAKCCPKCGKPA